MRIGFGVPTCGSWATPAIVNEVCRRADDLGYASLWTFQRLMYPEGTMLPETYHSVLDPMVSEAVGSRLPLASSASGPDAVLGAPHYASTL